MAQTDHKTYVQVQGSFFVAACQGCEIATAAFPTRSTLEEAETDAREHGELEHLAPREDLLAQAAASTI